MLGVEHGQLILLARVHLFGRRQQLFADIAVQVRLALEALIDVESTPWVMTVTSLLPTSTNPPSTNVQMLVSVLSSATPRRWTSPAPRRPIKGAPAAMPRLIKRRDTLQLCRELFVPG